MENKRTQWHPAFCSAMKLEFIENKNDLEYSSEVGLNSKPIVIDLLVITKSSDVVISNEIGRIFKGHNIFEYKSPGDALNIDTFYKCIAYASLYKAGGHYVDEIKANDITISFVRQEKPVKLMKRLQDENINIIEIAPGIYEIQSNFPYAMQIIVAKELQPDEHIWLSSLTDDMSLEKAKRLVIETSRVYSKDDKEYADSVMQVALSKNQQIFDLAREDSDMSDVLREFFQPEFDKLLEEAKAKQARELEAKMARELEAKMARELEAKMAGELEAKMAGELEARLAKELEARLADKDAEIAKLKAQLTAMGQNVKS